MDSLLKSLPRHISSIIGFILGIISISLLIWSLKISERHQQDMLVHDSIMEVQLKTSVYHLWIEEYINGDSHRSVKESSKYINGSFELIDAILYGGDVEHGRVLLPITNPEVRKKIEGIKDVLTNFNSLIQQRLKDVTKARVGSRLDQESDVAFNLFLKRAKEVEYSIVLNNKREFDKTVHLFWLILLLWGIVTISASFTFLRFENLKKKSETALQESYNKLEERVEQRTSELAESNKALRNEISEREKAQREQKEHYNLLKSIIDGTTDAIFIKDSKGNYLLVNSAFAELFGKKTQELVGKNNIDIFSKDVATEIVKNDMSVIQSGKTTTFEDEFVINDEKKIFLTTKGVYKGKDNEILGIFGISKDITDRKLVENTIKESEKKFREMFQCHSAAMFLVDPEEGSIIDANDSAATFYCYTKDELRNMKLSELSKLPPHLIASNIQRSLHQTRNYFTSKHKLANGTILDVEEHTSPVKVGGKTLLFSVIHNITERIHFENELRVKKEELEKFNKTLESKVVEESDKRIRQEQLLTQQAKLAEMGEMVGSIAHQWRQPLNTIGLIIQDLEDSYQYGDLTKELFKDSVEKTMEQINYMSKTIDDFRNFFKPSKTKVEFSLAEAINKVISIVSRQLDNYCIALELKAPVNTPILVHGYPSEFQQVVLNIINNAKDAIEGKISTLGDNTFAGTILIDIYQKENKRYIEISDNGGGIDEQNLDKVFDSYFTTKKEDGTGIGLYMSKTIIEDHFNGHLSVRNSDTGAIFTIEI
ncbi:MAG: PAS domain S-box protein [Nitrospinae bacterium]|nr:PAS domain S-box protein [Nitrospinota bacterium]